MITNPNPSVASVHSSAQLHSSTPVPSSTYSLNSSFSPSFLSNQPSYEDYVNMIMDRLTPEKKEILRDNPTLENFNAFVLHELSRTAMQPQDSESSNINRTNNNDDMYEKSSPRGSSSNVHTTESRRNQREYSPTSSSSSSSSSYRPKNDDRDIDLRHNNPSKTGKVNDMKRKNEHKTRCDNCGKLHVGRCWHTNNNNTNNNKKKRGPIGTSR
eukprot:TRINITY_DN4195_c4_g1_i1.p1 TRINITY_DN4195_c4_g1~~TRINITY_DN4195_c4_g1_i1.p1  ORF type:complete len:213 (+),score=50.46 TRINITY_DN4195_c4_g1_i1:210-848(+)